MGQDKKILADLIDKNKYIVWLLSFKKNQIWPETCKSTIWLSCREGLCDEKEKDESHTTQNCPL